MYILLELYVKIKKISEMGLKLYLEIVINFKYMFFFIIHFDFLSFQFSFKIFKNQT